jgi:hypothetical protein
MLGGATLLVVPGNHDVGSMQTVSEERLRAFEAAFGPANRVLCHGNVSFVTYNTQVMGPLSPPSLQAQVRAFLLAPETRAAIAACSGALRPVVVQHMPMFRSSDAECGRGADACADGEGDGGSPGYCRVAGGGTTFKARQEALTAWHDDVLDAAASDAVLAALRPAWVVSAHLHAPCRQHARGGRGGQRASEREE